MSLATMMYPNQRLGRPRLPGSYVMPAAPRPPANRNPNAILEALGQASGMNERDATAHMMRATAAYSPMARHRQDQEYDAQVNNMAGAIAAHRTMTDQPWGPHLAAAAGVAPPAPPAAPTILAAMGKVHDGPARPPGGLVLPPSASGITPPYPQAQPGLVRVPAGLPPHPVPDDPRPWMQPGAISTSIGADGQPLSHKQALGKIQAERAQHPEMTARTGRGNPRRQPATILGAMGQGQGQAASFDRNAMIGQAQQAVFSRRGPAGLLDFNHKLAMQDAELARSQSEVTQGQAQTDYHRAQIELANAQMGKVSAHQSPEQTRTAILLKTGDPALANEAGRSAAVDQALQAGGSIDFGKVDPQLWLERTSPNVAKLLAPGHDGAVAGGAWPQVYGQLRTLNHPDLDNPSSNLSRAIVARMQAGYGTDLLNELRRPARPYFDPSGPTPEPIDGGSGGLFTGFLDRAARQGGNILHNAANGGGLVLRPWADYNARTPAVDWYDNATRGRAKR